MSTEMGSKYYALKGPFLTIRKNILPCSSVHWTHKALILKVKVLEFALYKSWGLDSLPSRDFFITEVPEDTPNVPTPDSDLYR